MRHYQIGGKIMKLSKRAGELLLIIDQATDRDFDAKTIDRYFVPQRNDNICGAGDARCLRSLEGKGLIERMPHGSKDYSYAITEEGRLIAQTIG